MLNLTLFNVYLYVQNWIFIKKEAKKYPRIVRRGRLKCFHNGIILIVI